MRHDYNLPMDWEAMTDEEKCKWYTMRRAQRQAMSQKTTTGHNIQKEIERAKRKDKANSDTVENKR